LAKNPILRLIHALIDEDDIKRAYLMRLDVSSDRMVIENRNTPESKAASVWAMMSRKWNDPQFSPTTMKIDLHSDFHDPIAIDHDVVSDMTPATPLQAGTAPPPAIETVAAAATDPLPATFPGTPRAGAAPPPAIETVAAAKRLIRCWLLPALLLPMPIMSPHC